MDLRILLEWPAGEEALAFRLKLNQPDASHDTMELHLTAETEAKLIELARRTQRGTDELLQEAVEHLVTYSDWFERKVKNSLAATERGEKVPDADILAWLEQREHS